MRCDACKKTAVLTSLTVQKDKSFFFVGHPQHLPLHQATSLSPPAQTGLWRGGGSSATKQRGGGVRLLSRDDAQPWGSCNPRSTGAHQLHHGWDQCPLLLPCSYHFGVQHQIRYINNREIVKLKSRSSVKFQSRSSSLISDLKFGGKERNKVCICESEVILKGQQSTSAGLQRQRDSSSSSRGSRGVEQQRVERSNRGSIREGHMAGSYLELSIGVKEGGRRGRRGRWRRTPEMQTAEGQSLAEEGGRRGSCGRRRRTPEMRTAEGQSLAEEGDRQRGRAWRRKAEPRKAGGRGDKEGGQGGSCGRRRWTPELRRGVRELRRTAKERWRKTTIPATCIFSNWGQFRTFTRFSPSLKIPPTTYISGLKIPPTTCISGRRE